MEGGMTGLSIGKAGFWLSLVPWFIYALGIVCSITGTPAIPSLISGESKGKVARRAGVSPDCIRRLGHRLDAVMEEQIGRMLEEICCPKDMMEEALEYFLGRLRKRKGRR